MKTCVFKSASFSTTHLLDYAMTKSIQFHYHAAIIIRLERGSGINFIHLNFPEYLAGEIKQRSAHNGIVLGFQLVAIFEDENRRGCFVFYWCWRLNFGVLDRIGALIRFSFFLRLFPATFTRVRVVLTITSVSLATQGIASALQVSSAQFIVAAFTGGLLRSLLC